MGNEESEFESQFYQLYTFVGLVDVQHPLQQTVKIYRRRKVTFDYVMVFEKDARELEPAGIGSMARLEERLNLIRHYECESIARLQYWKLLPAKNCGQQTIRMYLEYYNTTLMDFLNAVRAKGAYFTFDEQILVIKSLAESMLAMRRMRIDSFSLDLNNIFVSACQGQVVLNPTYFLYQSVRMAASHRSLTSLTSEYEPYPLTKSSAGRSEENTPNIEQRQLQQLKKIFMDLARYLNLHQLGISANLYEILLRCTSLGELISQLPYSCSELNIEQFAQRSQESGNLYPRQL